MLKGRTQIRKNGTKKRFGNLRMKILAIPTKRLAHGGDEKDLIPISLIGLGVEYALQAYLPKIKEAWSKII